MASTYYDSTGKEVVDGDIAYAADINDINTAIDTGFQQVETAINAVVANQPYYATLAQKWAENPEDTEVTTGHYSALHWAAKASDAKDAALAAQAAAELAETHAETAESNAELAETNAETAEANAELAQVAAETAETNAELAETNAEAAQAAAEAAQAVAEAGYFDYIVDGDFNFWYEATTQTSSGYGSDTMWYNYNVGSTKTASRQAFTLGYPEVPGQKYYSRTVVIAVDTVSNLVYKTQRIEDVQRLSDKTVTLSFYAKANDVKYLSVDMIQNFGTGGSPSTSVGAIGTTKFTLSTNWQKFTTTIVIPSITSKTLGSNGDDYTALRFWFDAGSNYNTETDSLGHQSGTFDLAKVRLVLGSVDVDRDNTDVSLEGLRVSRYYNTGGVGADGGSGLRLADSAIAGYFLAAHKFRVPMRIAPAISYNTTSASYTNCSTIAATGITEYSFISTVTSTAADNYKAQGITWFADARL